MRARHRIHGFTLVELLVALFALAILALMSWCGLDGMVRAQAQVQARADEVLALQVGLAQWTTDLDAIVELPRRSALDWNGRVLRLVRRSGSSDAEGVIVAAWTRQAADGTSTWMRWQSPPLRTGAELEQAWLQADLWARNPDNALRARQVSVVPIEDWQIFYFRSDAWTNPQSSDAQAPAPAAGAAPENAPASEAAAVLPDGVRLVLVLPAGRAVSGTVTLDWVSPRVGGGKS